MVAVAAAAVAAVAVAALGGPLVHAHEAPGQILPDVVLRMTQALTDTGGACSHDIEADLELLEAAVKRWNDSGSAATTPKTPAFASRERLVASLREQASKCGSNNGQKWGSGVKQRDTDYCRMSRAAATPARAKRRVVSLPAAASAKPCDAIAKLLRGKQQNFCKRTAEQHIPVIPASCRHPGALHDQARLEPTADLQERPVAMRHLHR